MVLVAHSKLKQSILLVYISTLIGAKDSNQFPICTLPSVCLPLLFIPPSSFFTLRCTVCPILYFPSTIEKEEGSSTCIYIKREENYRSLLCVFVATHSREEGLVRSARVLMLKGKQLAVVVPLNLLMNFSGQCIFSPFVYFLMGLRGNIFHVPDDSRAMERMRRGKKWFFSYHVGAAGIERCNTTASLYSFFQHL